MTSGHEIALLSSLLDACADQICPLYRFHSTIKIISRRLRQYLPLNHFFSHQPVSIMRQILTALIGWGLLVIASQDSAKLYPKQL